MKMVARLMSTQAEAVVARIEHSHTVRVRGAKMILPLLAVAAPKNFESVEMVELMLHQGRSCCPVARVEHSHAVCECRRKDDLAVARDVMAPSDHHL